MRTTKRPRFTRSAYAAAAVLERWKVCEFCEGVGATGGKVCGECVGTGVQRRANPIEIGREGWRILREVEDAIITAGGIRRHTSDKGPDEDI